MTSYRQLPALDRAIVQGAAEGMITIDSEGVVLAVNPAAAELFGHTPDALMGQLTQLYQNLLGNALKFVGDRAPVVRLTIEHVARAASLAFASMASGSTPTTPSRSSLHSSACTAPASTTARASVSFTLHQRTMDEATWEMRACCAMEP